MEWNLKPTADRFLRIALCAMLVASLLHAATLAKPPEAYGMTGTATSVSTGTTIGVLNTDGSQVSFAEGIMYVDGVVALCVNYQNPFQPGGVHSVDALDYFGGNQEIVTIIGLIDYIVHKADDGLSSMGYSFEQLYYAQQMSTWAYLGTYLGWNIQTIQTSGGIGSVPPDEWYNVLWPKISGFVETHKATAKGSGTVWISNTGGQQLLTSATVELSGKLDLQKASSKPTLTDNNASYSLAGAEFDIWRDGVTHAGTLMTDDNGYALSGDLPVGTYAIIEKTAPRGYQLDKTPYWATVIAGQTVRINPGNSVVPNNPEYGFADLQKVSSDTDITNENECYSLEGAEYGIFRKSDGVDRVASITTDASGYAKSSELGLGEYFVKEMKAPEGYALDENTYSITVSAGNTVRVNTTTVVDHPQGDPVDLVLEKIDADTISGSPQGAASLAGAEFTVKYYDGLYSSAAQAAAAQNPMRTWVLKTDDMGNVVFDQAHLVTGDEFYRIEGKPCFPVGTVIIQETKAPQGYRLDDGKGGPPPAFCIPIRGDGSTSTTVEAFIAPEVADTVMRGDIRIVKEVPTNLDPENQETTRIVVEGIEFHVINDNDNAVLSPDTGETIAPGDIVTTMITDENGFASTKTMCPTDWSGALAYGTYRIHEVIPDEVAKRYKDEYGITILPVDDFKMHIDEEGQYRIPTLVSNNIPQTPLRIVKVDADSGKTIPLDCAFTIYDATGERVVYADRASGETIDTWHTGNDGELTLPMKLSEGEYRIVEVVAPDGYVLDATGIDFSVKDYQTWDNPITITYENEPITGEIQIIKTNSYDGSVLGGAEYSLRAATDITTGDGTVHAKKNELVASGILTDENGCAQIKDLHLGRYRLYETKAPTGYALDTQEHIIEVSSQGQDTPVVSIRAELENSPTTLIIRKVDQFSKAPLEGATYRIWQDAYGAGTVDEDPGIDEEPEPTFEYSATTDVNGEIRLPYLLPGTYHVIEVQAPSGYLLPDDLESVNFTVDDQGMIAGSSTYVIEQTNYRIDIASKAVDGTDGDKEVAAQPGATVIDTLFFEHLDTDVEYTVSGILMDKTTGKPLLIDGMEVKVEKSFSTASQNGTIDVEFVFDASGIELNSLVVFEYLYKDGVLVAEHADIEDADQTVDLMAPSIGTSATDASDGDKTIVAEPHVTIVDTVYYKNLVPGLEYVVEGELVNATTGEAILYNGAPVTASKTFTPDECDGTVEVSFTFDAQELSGTPVVVFEHLFLESKEVASHADLEDKGQTVEVMAPKIGTSASGAEFNDNVVVGNQETTIVDTVLFEGLTPGCEYKLRGTLMDKEKGAPLQLDGKSVESHLVFIAEQGSGAVDVEFTFDARELRGKDIVVFEWLDKDGEEIANHTDIDDVGQTVRIEDKAIHTIASETGTGAKKIVNGSDAKITDTVSFEGLTPGKSYTIEGTLINRSTGEPITDNGHIVLSTLHFVPGSANGSVDIEFNFDARSLREASVVVFETLYDDSGEIASHKDISDDNQTVWVSQVPVGKTYDKTGVDAGKMALTVLGGIAIACTGVVAGRNIVIRNRRKLQRESALASIDRLD